MSTTTERKPLLSDEYVANGMYDSARATTPWNVRDFYEAKIASGELMVVKTTTLVRHDKDDGMRYCASCGHFGKDDDLKPFNYCPGCGAKFVE